MPYTAAPFLVLFSKKYREKESKKNTSGQLRLGTAVEFDDERKRVFGWRVIELPPQRCCSPLFRKEGQYFLSAVFWAGRPRPYGC